MFIGKSGSVNKCFYIGGGLIFVLILSAIVLANQSSRDLEVSAAITKRQNQTLSNPNGNQQKINLPQRPPHKHPAFGERQRERARMVKHQIEARGVKDPNVLAALEAVPRHIFVRPEDRQRAYNDQPLPIGFGQTISQPYIVGFMTEVLSLKPTDKVLEIGTGSGYQAAICAEIAREVYTIEIIEELAKSARERLKELGYPNLFVKDADGYFGWQEKAEFEAIIVTAVAGFVPPPLIKQLKPGGRMVLPLGSPYGDQTLVLISKDDKGTIQSYGLLPVRFVPMLGKIMEGKGRPEK